MSDQVLSSNFVQKVFDTISLEKNMDLWMSEEDVMLKNRIEFLADYPETMFPDYLFNNSKRANLAKNIMLCKGFKTKAEKLEVTENWTQALALYNQSITFAPAEENSLIEHLVCKQNDIMAKIIDRDHSSKDDAANIGFANSITIKQTKHQGRFTVANRDIKAGELLAVDAPAVKHLDKEYIKTHCWHCLKSTYRSAIVPCSMCSGVLFCCEQCRKTAQDSYHRHECGLTDMLYKSDVGVWILAHRTVASQPKSVFLEDNQMDPSLHEYTQLVTHYGSDKFSAPELMKEALVCVFFTRCLQATGYFDKYISEPSFGKEELQIALWIHRFMRIARFNCHAIREVNPVQDPTKQKLETQSIGVAVNPTLAMINHSCDSNYGRVWNLNGNIVYAFATRPIKSGEEITDGYSGVYANVPQEEREQIHLRYHFECGCIACKESWPLKNALNQRMPNRKDKSLARLKQLMKQKDQTTNTPKEKYEVLLEAVSLAYQILQRPHLVICILEDDLYNQLRIIH